MDVTAGNLMAEARRDVLEAYLWDQQERTLTVIYRSHIDGRITSCLELMQFDPDGCIVAVVQNYHDAK
jgi:hypothetical protein